MLSPVDLANPSRRHHLSLVHVSKCSVTVTDVPGLQALHHWREVGLNNSSSNLHNNLCNINQLLEERRLHSMVLVEQVLVSIEEENLQ